MELLDSSIEILLAHIDLNLLGIVCALNHGPGIKPPIAVDYICQYVGNGEEKVLFRIPVCATCLASLFSEYQLLMYCLNCNSSQWIFLPDSKRIYDKNTKIIFLKECPKCYDSRITEKSI